MVDPAEAARTLAVPSIHMNGTAKATLLAEAILDCDTMRDAIAKLQSHAPHSRDYYVQSAGAYNRAIAQHLTRMGHLNAVLRELETLAESIDAGGYQVSGI